MIDTKWGVFRLDGNEIHVAPINDIREHILDVNCNCNPEIKNEDEFKIVIHSAWDFREIMEELEDGTFVNSISHQ